jgi:CBS domain-containing protein
LNTKLVSSIEAATRSRLVTVSVGTLLREVARLLCNTQISLVVVCDQAGAMAGVVTKTDIVRQIGYFEGAAYTKNAADLMTRELTFCRATDVGYR